MRLLSASLILGIAACSSSSGEDQADERTLADAFMEGMVDEIRGAPDDAELRERTVFDEGGVRFAYPKPLRKVVDRDGYTNWSVNRGDFEIELHLPDGDVDAAGYLGHLVPVLGEGHPIDGPKPGRSVRWCGTEITGVRYRFTFFGDPHIVEGFDLPDEAGGSNRFIVVADMRVDDDWSPLAKASFDALDATIRCDEGSAR